MNKTINQDNLNATRRFLQKQGEISMAQLKEADPQQAEWLEKLGDLFANEDFIKQFFACTENQQGVKLFADNGITVTEEQVEAMGACINAMIQNLRDNDGELSEEELEQIAGGGFFSCFGMAIGGNILGAGIGATFGCLAALFFPPAAFGLVALAGCAIGGTAMGVALGVDQHYKETAQGNK